MIRFRNPGTQYSTQIQVFRELYKEYKDAPSFTLDDMAVTITKTMLMTAYGYAGDAALALSNTENDSLNSTKMNAKMYAEIFRLLGWITSEGTDSYPLVFTYIGEHVAIADDVLPLYEQCVLGINNPQEIMDVKYDEKVRFFKAALFSLEDLDGVMYKHELCIGPMSINDLDNRQYQNMIKYIKGLRGNYKKYQTAYQQLCETLDVKPTLPDNSTRLPIAFMKTCNWVESKRTNQLYPPKSLSCLYITEHGKKVAKELKCLKDLRLDEFKRCTETEQYSLIRLGVYFMLKRAGYDIAPVEELILSDLKICEHILEGKELLFSPYQTLHHTIVDNALGIKKTERTQSNKSIQLPEMNKTNSVISNILLKSNKKNELNQHDPELMDFRNYVLNLQQKGFTSKEIVEKCFEERINDTQTKFYPFIAMLFRAMGLECYASRPGDNGARWDAIIINDKESIPIEIKSPTEEQHLSLKAIRQALENKIILLSRKTFQTLPLTTTLAVGYFLPNDRAEVSGLINDFKLTYGYNIGVIDLKTLLIIVVSILCDGKTFELKQLFRLEGFANATIE